MYRSLTFGWARSYRRTCFEEVVGRLVVRFPDLFLDVHPEPFLRRHFCTTWLDVVNVLDTRALLPFDSTPYLWIC